MNTNIVIHILDPDDPVRAQMSGTDHSIPVVSLGALYGPSVDILLNTQLLTPAAQASWLRSLAAAATDLAAQAEGAVLAGGGS